MLSRLGSSFPSLAFVSGFVTLAWVVLRERPRLLLAAWLAVICFVPWWTGVDFGVGVFLPAACVISIFALTCFLPMRAGRFCLTDLVAIALFTACLVPVVIGVSTRAAVFGLLVVWLPAYLVGRSIVFRVGVPFVLASIAIIFSVVAVLAILESLAGFNPFVGFRFAAGPSYQVWSGLVERGGRIRVEGAFGNPIALGASLALAIPLTLASPLRLVFRLAAITVMSIAIVLTFSRTGMISGALGLGLGLLFLREGLSARARAVSVVAIGAVAFVLVPLVTSTFTAAGSEASGSAEYRERLTSLIGDMNLVGVSGSATTLANGEVFFGRFRSIDSQLILVGLTYGSLAAVIALFVLTCGTGMLLAGRATPVTIAVLAQIPNLATVALITQYTVFFWFAAGLAAATHALHASGSADHVGSSAAREEDVKRASKVGTGKRAGGSGGQAVEPSRIG